jgi:tetratricopeptide (TPR) repeat protein
LNVTEFTYLINKPDAVNDKQTVFLEQIVNQFPYFQSARALRLKALYNQDSFQYNNALKVAAAHTADRSVLFDFITSDTFTAIHKGLYQQKLAELYGIEVREIEVVTPDEQLPVVDKVEQSILTSIRQSEVPYEEPVEEVVVDEAQVEAAVLPVENFPHETESATALDLQDEEVAIAEQDAPPTPEEKLELGKPLAFSKDEKHSFSEWLQLSGNLHVIDRTEEVEEQPTLAEIERQKKTDIIDKFIKTNPKIPPVKPDVRLINVVEPQVQDHSALMTETLARVYLEQKKYQKAIQAYEILILKNPEKSSFFADRISEIKLLQNNQ